MAARKGISVVVSIAVLSTLFVSCSAYRSWQLKPEGNKIIAKIEAYREQNKRLPNSLNDIGIKETEEGPIYYRKKDDDKYVVWFGMELGESVTYDSATMKWNK